MTSTRRLLLLVGSALAILAAFASCSGPDGTTPKCNDDVTRNGIDPNAMDGCNPFPPLCKSNDPMVCCAGKMGSDLDLCLYAYGELRLSTASASSTTSAGGAGGAGGTGATGGNGGTGG